MRCKAQAKGIVSERAAGNAACFNAESDADAGRSLALHQCGAKQLFSNKSDKMEAGNPPEFPAGTLSRTGIRKGQIEGQIKGK
jgi:hypothetical protein